jgi:hypothetical protein
MQQWLASPDTVSDVIHDAAQRPSGRKRSSIVDNSADGSPANVNNLSQADEMPTSPAKTRILPSAHADSIVPDATTPRRHDAVTVIVPSAFEAYSKITGPRCGAC